MPAFKVRLEVVRGGKGHPEVHDLLLKRFKLRRTISFGYDKLSEYELPPAEYFGVVSHNYREFAVLIHGAAQRLLGEEYQVRVLVAEVTTSLGWLSKTKETQINLGSMGIVGKDPCLVGSVSDPGPHILRVELKCATHHAPAHYKTVSEALKPLGLKHTVKCQPGDIYELLPNEFYAHLTKSGQDTMYKIRERVSAVAPDHRLWLCAIRHAYGYLDPVDTTRILPRLDPEWVEMVL